MDIKQYLQYVVDSKASDLHLISGIPPTLRIDGELKAIGSVGVLTPDSITELLEETLSSAQLERLSANKELDFSFPFSEKARFRVNAYTQKNSLAAAFRQIPLDIPDIESLGLPPILHSFTNLKQGFILVTGPTGHGKSTTLAAMLNEINKTRATHIVTIEDPVEFIFRPDKSIISQREMGEDTHSWSVALRSVLREDPDVVLVGEMRDYETIAAALTVAETGHLVFATLHTNSAAQSVDRIVDVFPEEQQKQVRLQLSNTLEAVFSQRLIPAINRGRVVTYEVMLATNAIRTAIRDGKTHLLDNVIRTSADSGMTTLENSMATLIRSGNVSLDEAIAYCLNPEDLMRLVRS
ncbi:MAG: Twitching motility protein [Candidatus Woesebacteria bacterium GW2011_GWA2_40_7b]|uniref:Twitching motility protein n=1 Tax=Candidatus Woesebacteria bacterium GW2011_GWA2_40_7b TaxID=1618563 RepID=A0A0G0T7D1_9BACT|nr:MAG: Twitching motility protein [Candidatus Woesebacteria bacterium GW2011_GWA2_40_7b]